MLLVLRIAPRSDAVRCPASTGIPSWPDSSIGPVTPGGHRWSRELTSRSSGVISHPEIVDLKTQFARCPSDCENRRMSRSSICRSRQDPRFTTKRRHWCSGAQHHFRAAGTVSDRPRSPFEGPARRPPCLSPARRLRYLRGAPTTTKAAANMSMIGFITPPVSSGWHPSTDFERTPCRTRPNWTETTLSSGCFHGSGLLRRYGSVSPPGGIGSLLNPLTAEGGRLPCPSADDIASSITPATALHSDCAASRAARTSPSLRPEAPARRWSIYSAEMGARRSPRRCTGESA